MIGGTLTITRTLASALDAYRAATAEVTDAARELRGNPDAFPRFEAARKAENDAARWLAAVLEARASSAAPIAKRIEALCSAFGLRVVETDAVTTPELSRADRSYVLHVPLDLDPLDTLLAVVVASSQIAGEPVANVARAFKVNRALKGAA